MKAASIAHLESSLYLGHIRQRCSYLPDRQASLLYLRGGMGADEYRRMLDRGYRRSGVGLYRPDCEGCRECRILRISVAGFQPTRSQRRVWRRGGSVFHFEIVAPSFHPRKLQMYERYLMSQHHTHESDLSEEGYLAFFVASFLGNRTRELNLYAGHRLVGAGIFDVLKDTLSSVYFFFDPEFARFSPGAYSMLLEIDLARKMDLSYYYPGYYIAQCPAMSYKGDYGPAEVRTIGKEDFHPLSHPD